MQGFGFHNSVSENDINNESEALLQRHAGDSLRHVLRILSRSSAARGEGARSRGLRWQPRPRLRKLRRKKKALSTAERAIFGLTTYRDKGFLLGVSSAVRTSAYGTYDRTYQAFWACGFRFGAQGLSAFGDSAAYGCKAHGVRLEAQTGSWGLQAFCGFGCRVPCLRRGYPVLST